MSVRSGRAALPLAARSTSVGLARRFVRLRLDELSVPEPPLEDAVLLTSELVTNALLHAGAGLEVRLDTDSQRVRIEVHDGDQRLPLAATAAADATSGRGLLIVGRLATDWGVDRSAGGKSVWFEMDLAPSGA
jgi:anti-sigma regulatory factor (Ser/Thr protein kinase)